MIEPTIYVNITSEGAKINPQVLDHEDHALAMFLMWKSNDTVVQAQVTGFEKVKHYYNGSEGQIWKEEDALVIQFGPSIGFVPVSEAGGLNNVRQFSRYVGRYIAVIPDRFNPNVEGKPLLLFSRSRALQLMQGANEEKIRPGSSWTAVVSNRTPAGYIVNIGGFRAWLPLSLVSHTVAKPNEFALGDTFEVKIMESSRRVGGSRLLVVSKRDASPHPYDLHASQYRQNGVYLAEIKTISGRLGYASLPTGVTVRVQARGEREVLRTGSQVLVQVRRDNPKDKVLEGIVTDVLHIPPSA